VNRPDTVPVNADGIPRLVREKPRWCNWAWEYDAKTQKWTKPPLTSDLARYASHQKPDDYSSFEEALAVVQAGKADGVGFALLWPFVGIDLDEELPDEARRDIITKLDSYTERSPSGTGEHVVVRATWDGSGRHPVGIGVFQVDRWWYMTGQLVEGRATIENREFELEFVLSPYLPKATKASSTAAPVEPEMPDSVPEHLLARLEEASGDRSAQTFAFVKDCLAAGLSDAEAKALALRHGPTREKYGSRAAEEIDRVLDKDEVRPTGEAETPAVVDTDPTVTFAEFVGRRDETQQEALITCEQGTLVPAGGLVLLGATVGHGKTTFTVELVLHAVAGRDYLGFSFTRPLRVLVIENEGPRIAFQEKLEARLENWEHGGEPRVWDEPAAWGQIRISDKAVRERLRAAIEKHRIDLVVSDSLTRFGVRGNGSPEETREFIELLTELGLGRDVAFLLLHHPRTRPEKGEPEVERIAGAWPPHADLIMLLVRYPGHRARLCYPKTRWANGECPPCLLAFDPATQSFSYIGVDEREERDYAAEIVALMKRKPDEWWTVSALRKKKDDGGIGADNEAVKTALADEHFESIKGDQIGKRKDSTYYRLKCRGGSDDTHDTHDTSTLWDEEDEEASASSPIEDVTGDDASSSVPEPSSVVSRGDSSRDDTRHERGEA
jgi:hypothetical protein